MPEYVFYWKLKRCFFSSCIFIQFRAHRRGGGEHFLGLDGGRCEEGIFGAGGEIGEVGHKISSFM